MVFRTTQPPPKFNRREADDGQRQTGSPLRLPLGVLYPPVETTRLKKYIGRCTVDAGRQYDHTRNPIRVKPILSYAFGANAGTALPLTDFQAALASLNAPR